MKVGAAVPDTGFVLAGPKVYLDCIFSGVTFRSDMSNTFKIVYANSVTETGAGDIRARAQSLVLSSESARTFLVNFSEISPVSWTAGRSAAWGRSPGARDEVLVVPY